MFYCHAIMVMSTRMTRVAQLRLGEKKTNENNGTVGRNAEKDEQPMRKPLRFYDGPWGRWR